MKIYPGVFSQVLEGADGILRMPGGCFEQTSSSAYPERAGRGLPQADAHAVAGRDDEGRAVPQRRLPTAVDVRAHDGGFDWWGQESNEPLIWVSAYGLQEFNDMSKVYPVDRGVIDRTQAWLLKQQAADGTWEKIGMTHSETIASNGRSEIAADQLRDLVAAGQRA